MHATSELRTEFFAIKLHYALPNIGLAFGSV
jgi:hypothetical protein